MKSLIICCFKKSTKKDVFPMVVKWVFRKIFYIFVKATKKYVWALANAYDLPIKPPAFPHGRHALNIKDHEEAIRHRIPKSVYFNTGSGSITVGHNVIFGEDVKILCGMHMNIEDASLAGVELHHVPESGRDVLIEEDCYIGSGAIIIGPAVIGRQSVIAAGSVVVRDVPPRALVMGVPAKVVKFLKEDSNTF